MAAMSSHRPFASLLKNVGLSVAALLLFFGFTEAALALYGFEYARVPRFVVRASQVDDYIASQNRNVPQQHFVAHPTRWWTAEPGVGKVNATGYQGRVISRTRTSGRTRILFLGDSCTNAGPYQYPEQVLTMLANEGVEAEALIAAVGGYSTHQGLDFLRESLVYKPDVVTAYFGWNDHWLSPGGVPDNEILPPSAIDLLVRRSVARLRTYQLMDYLLEPPRPQPRSDRFEDLLASTRVPPRYFEENVRRMIQVAASAGAPVVFIAPPWGENITVTAKDHLFPTRLIPRVHRHYRRLLAAIVAEYPDRAILVDLPNPVLELGSIKDDGIHPTAQGYARIATYVADALLTDDLIASRLRRTPPDAD